MGARKRREREGRLTTDADDGSRAQEDSDSRETTEKKKKRKKSTSEAREDVEGEDAVEVGTPEPEEPNPLALDNFALSEPVKATLRKKGFDALFAIQAETLEIALSGKDVVGRARTGCGKTLAFVLPIVEEMAKISPMPANGRRVQGRRPMCVVLAPTRELAKQVFADFDWIGNSFGFKSVCVYGGTPYREQEMGLRGGCDIVIGTPGRMKDHLERKTLMMDKLKFRVLDDCLLYTSPSPRD